MVLKRYTDLDLMIDHGAKSLVEMLFYTGLLALVGAVDQLQRSTKKPQIVSTKVLQDVDEVLTAHCMAFRDNPWFAGCCFRPRFWR